MRIEFSSNGGQLESWQPVTLNDADGDEDTFDVLVRHPTFDQKMADSGMALYSLGSDTSLQRAIHRITSAIVGWRGLQHKLDGDVYPKEDDIPFNETNLHALCSQYPSIADQLFILAHRAFEGTLPTVDKVKNSRLPSSVSAADGNEKTSIPDSSSATTQN